MYKYSHNSGWGKVWIEHYRAFAQFLYKFSDTKKGVLEIGGGNGLLNAIYNSMYEKVDWSIVEPSNVQPVSECTASYIRSMWDTRFDIEAVTQPFQVLIHSHVLEHLFDINGFMEQNKEILKTGQRMIFSIPNLKETLTRKYTNALNFEHTYFITDEYVEYILENYGFQVIAKELYREEHSIFYATEKVESCEKKEVDFKKAYENNKKLFDNYIVYHKQLIARLNQAMENEKRSIYLFGAHIFSQYLINFGLNTSKIVKILDNDVLKQGKRLYGTNLMVTSPKVLQKEDKPIVILKVATYADEIKEDILKHINKNTEFWE